MTLYTNKQIFCLQFYWISVLKIENVTGEIPFYVYELAASLCFSVSEQSLRPANWKPALAQEVIYTENDKVNAVSLVGALKRHFYLINLYDHTNINDI